MQYTISHGSTEEILNRDYNLTKLRKVSIKKLTKILSEDKVRVWKEKIKNNEIQNLYSFKKL